MVDFVFHIIDFRSYYLLSMLPIPFIHLNSPISLIYLSRCFSVFPIPYCLIELKLSPSNIDMEMGTFVYGFSKKHTNNLLEFIKRDQFMVCSRMLGGLDKIVIDKQQYNLHCIFAHPGIIGEIMSSLQLFCAFVSQ